MIVISLTSIAGNCKVLIKTLQSLLEQTVLPDAIWLYLSEEPYLLDTGFPGRILPPFLSDFIQQHRIISVKWTKNTGPYRKLLPAYSDLKDTDSIIVTVDDDTEYVPTFLEYMLKEWKEHGCAISYRAVGFSAPFGEWKYYQQSPPCKKSVMMFHTGKGGVLYHTSFFRDFPEFLSGPYLTLADTGDDVWFNFWRIKSDIPCYYLSEKPYMKKDNITKYALFNNFNGTKNGEKNDKMMKDTYNYLFLEGTV